MTNIDISGQFLLQMNVTCLHVSANCNPKPNVLAFLAPHLLAFAFADQIAIYSLEQSRIISTISDKATSGSRVNCIAVYDLAGPMIVCGYDSGVLAVYRQSHQQSWVKIASYTDSAALTSINLLVQHQNRVHIFTNNHSSVVKHLVYNSMEILLASSLTFPLNKLVESLASCIFQNRVILFVAGADQKIHFYQNPLPALQHLAYRFSLGGHEDAITKLALVKLGQDFTLASSSKDGYIRLWKLSLNDTQVNVNQTNNHCYQVTPTSLIYLESVLISHESSVTSLAWLRTGPKFDLISCSLDSTICIWRSDSQGRWEVASRLGQLIGNKNAFFDVATDPSCTYLAALNYTGAVLIWKEAHQQFILRHSFTGHSDHVTGIDWNHSGHFLVSTSKDQSTRIMAKNNSTNTFHEISRAQIHGYDINAVCTLRVKDDVIDVIACGADEKVIRLLEPPACFANYLNTFTKANLHLFFNSPAEENLYKMSKPQDPVLLYTPYSEGGTQVLGLMTKMQKIEREKITSYYDQQQGGLEEQQQNEAESARVADQALNYTLAPHEDYLIKHTLWPQINKLYGHPHQIFRLCRSNDSSKLASSCKAQHKDAASLIIWDTRTWQIIKILREHSYTVNAMEFSTDDQLFASVSKDRKLALFDATFEVLYTCEPHLRAITCLSFHLSQNWLLTGSRDKTVKLHNVQTKSIVGELHFESPVCSVAFCKQQKMQNCLAVGLSNGAIILCLAAECQLKIIGRIPAEWSHTQEVNCLKWNLNLLASCSNDHSTRIFEVLPAQ